MRKYVFTLPAFLTLFIPLWRYSFLSEGLSSTYLIVQICWCQILLCNVCMKMLLVLSLKKIFAAFVILNDCFQYFKDCFSIVYWFSFFPFWWKVRDNSYLCSPVCILSSFSDSFAIFSVLYHCFQHIHWYGFLCSSCFKFIKLLGFS